MGIIGGSIGYRLLRLFSSEQRTSSEMRNRGYSESKLETLFGTDIWAQVRGKTVIDFGCGRGEQLVEMAHQGARRVIGLEIQPKHLEAARRHAQEAGLAERCVFTERTQEKADVIFSLDAFEHFTDPQDILRQMRGLLKDDGCAFISFGPTWYHPLGGHLFSVFPWAHLLFTEKALLRWRSDFIHDGATSFGEVSGGLNQMSIRRFEQIVRDSDFRCVKLELVPVRNLRLLVNPFTRELFTALVQCHLIPC